MATVGFKRFFDECVISPFDVDANRTAECRGESAIIFKRQQVKSKIATPCTTNDDDEKYRHTLVVDADYKMDSTIL
jgi:hypothetical protein